MARTIEVYDPTANTWAAKTQHVVGSSDTAEAINGKIYVAKPTATEVHGPATDTWGSLTAMPIARQNTVGGVINGKLYAVGGYIAGQAAAALEVYTPDSDADGIIDSLDAFLNDPAASTKMGIRTGGTRMRRPRRLKPQRSCWTPSQTIQTNGCPKRTSPRSRCSFRRPARVFLTP